MTRTHREVIGALPPETRAALVEKRDAPGLLRLAVHLGAIALLSALILVGVPFWPVLMLPLGVLIVFLFTLLHETVHETVFCAPRWNRWAGALCGFLLILPPLWFRYFHLAHHRHTQDPAKDPELAEPKPETAWRYLVHVSGLPLWRSSVTTLVRLAAGRDPGDFVPKSARARVQAEARILLALYALLIAASVLIGWTGLIFIWVLPVLLGQPVLRLYLLAEHGRCAYVANMLENTRTTFTNRAIRWLAWNMPYHTEHHSFPAVPFHRLPELHRLIAGDLRVTERGYVPFHRRWIRDLVR